MRVLVTGATGYVGRFVTQALTQARLEPIAAGRHPLGPQIECRNFSLEPGSIEPALFDGIDALVHCALAHLPGKYRGGEGDDPQEFRRLNVEGTLRLASLARSQGVSRAIFISSRAVYGPHSPGQTLHEDMECRPDTLYGEVKLAGETAFRALSSPDFMTASLRLTGVYGLPGQICRMKTDAFSAIVDDLVHGDDQTHKWSGLFADYLRGEVIPPRAGTEIHGDRVGTAVVALLMAPASAINGEIFNMSGPIVDRRELLAIVRKATGAEMPLPRKAPASDINIMSSEKLETVMRDFGSSTFPRAML